jgi:nitrogen-specific signal transduction histidine kinase
LNADDVVRDLAHELRQPLSAIEAIAYYLEMTLPAEQVAVRQHLLRIQKLVEQSSDIVSRAVHDARPA